MKNSKIPFEVFTDFESLNSFLAKYTHNTTFIIPEISLIDKLLDQEKKLMSNSYESLNFENLKKQKFPVVLKVDSFNSFFGHDFVITILNDEDRDELFLFCKKIVDQKLKE